MERSLIVKLSCRSIIKQSVSFFHRLIRGSNYLVKRLSHLSKESLTDLRNIRTNEIFAISLGKQGWRSADRAHLPPMWPGFKSWTPVSKVG